MIFNGLDLVKTNDYSWEKYYENYSFNGEYYALYFPLFMEANNKKKIFDKIVGNRK
ncbi:hypothetical protein IMX26_13915 [Clostridium sp. 'deep sea']|uniref:hypothetical protein n=1 Tax=Clostridium sp. 'deep sea' TaxID=2779445 RepID=UPI00189661BB|nr:hypothetical protein [Clostridium sp. 'deep sea']QOR34560.1 hypothetical protein IMX26_13915 [Clostridium sp. 'deep sea']